MTTGPQSNLSAPAGYSLSDLVCNDIFKQIASTLGEAGSWSTGSTQNVGSANDTVAAAGAKRFTPLSRYWQAAYAASHCGLLTTCVTNCHDSPASRWPKH
jgi:hypothetical protein